jgi:hypothetical protein
LKTRSGSLSSEGANGEIQAERPTTIKILRSLEHSNAFISNADTTFNIINAGEGGKSDSRKAASLVVKRHLEKKHELFFV